MKQEDTTPSLSTILIVGGGLLVGLTAATAPANSTRFQVAMAVTFVGVLVVKPILLLGARAGRRAIVRRVLR